MAASGLSLAQIAQVIKGDCQDPTIIRDVVTDSRQLQARDLFVALKGDRFNGHDFLTQVAAAGAAGVVVSDPPLANLGIPVFHVPDTLVAYQQLAQYWRSQWSMPIIGITGSVGKTTTKELIAAVLATQGTVHKTQKNFNNEIGVPKTLLQIEAKHDYAVVEMAMRARGEIALLAEIAQPTIGLITNVGTAHIGRLGSEQAIAEAKCELLGHMPSDSLAILNADNQRLMDTAATVWQGKTITYGLQQGDLQGTLLDAHTVQINGQTYPLPLPGEHNASNYLAALAVAQAVGIDITQFAGQQLVVELPGGRAKQWQLASDIVLLDETYNAGYESMVAALKLLKATPGQRHIAVLGTMKELGEASAQLHRQVGEQAEALG
ncbi:MAG: UDP-N-acetylmuramoyl-tripeptide--D-alanyl-D-alanine ligase, partial [Spirulina sp. SIO3F2]|nr:UDP-N-acetylmuramoyl-tripeptide--D-alanyl-D-alanine ligase [Spirulina sp. SIO3F2]